MMRLLDLCLLFLFIVMCAGELHYHSPMYDMMAEYMKQHSLSALMKDSAEELCSRRFVVGKIDCNGMGNRNNQFLDNFMWAAVFNRTFIAHPFDSEHCAGSVGPRYWICNNTMIIQLLNNAGCPMPDEVAKERFGKKNTFTSMQHGNYHIDGIRCCQNLERMLQNITFISPGLVPSIYRTRLAYGALNPHYGSTQWSEETLHRFKVLSGVDRYPHDASRGYTTYGHLAIMSIRYSDTVRKMTKNLLARLYNLPAETFLNNVHDDGDDLYKFSDLQLRVPANLTIFGYHGRHQKLDPTVENKLDVESIKCLFHDARKTIIQLTSDEQNSQQETNGKDVQECVVLIASDRPHTFETVKEKAAEQGCRAVFVARSLNLSSSAEHGPWGTLQGDSSPDIARADTLLLSHSNYFIGLLQSTYSLFIANIVAARSEISHFYHFHQYENTTDSKYNFHSSHHIWAMEGSKCSHFIDAAPQGSKCEHAMVAGRNGYCRSPPKI